MKDRAAQSGDRLVVHLFVRVILGPGMGCFSINGRAIVPDTAVTQLGEHVALAGEHLVQPGGQLAQVGEHLALLSEHTAQLSKHFVQEREHIARKRELFVLLDERIAQ